MVSVPSVTLPAIYWEMYRLTFRPIYCDEQEHLREFLRHGCSPWSANKFTVTTAEASRTIGFVEAQCVRERDAEAVRAISLPRWAEG